ncbi:hypothetical protein MAR_035608 [Mya arenaria]|uniref:Uncharacterized protein n=1 Tax=Mya arenaria TaxID=6604 RepID=A0ABY7ENB3_MYAAR|nr:hypothetical protein MAR_035608 [Mya arenaria]
MKSKHARIRSTSATKNAYYATPFGYGSHAHKDTSRCSELDPTVLSLSTLPKMESGIPLILDIGPYSVAPVGINGASSCTASMSSLSCSEALYQITSEYSSKGRIEQGDSQYDLRIKERERRKLKAYGYAGVYINEGLTRERSSDFYHARSLLKTKNITSVWTADGTILVRVNHLTAKMFRQGIFSAKFTTFKDIVFMCNGGLSIFLLLLICIMTPFKSIKFLSELCVSGNPGGLLDW